MITMSFFCNSSVTKPHEKNSVGSLIFMFHLFILKHRLCIVRGTKSKSNSWLILIVYCDLWKLEPVEIERMFYKTLGKDFLWGFPHGNDGSKVHSRFSLLENKITKIKTQYVTTLKKNTIFKDESWRHDKMSVVVR